MATKKVEVDEKVIAIQAQMDQKVEEIHQVEQEQAELQALLGARVQQIKDSYQSKFDTLGNKIQYLTTELKAMFEQVPQKVAKTQRKVSLLSGDVVVKNASQKLDYDKKILLEYAESEISKYEDEVTALHDAINYTQLQIDELRNKDPLNKQIEELTLHRIELEAKLDSLSCPWIDLVKEKVVSDFDWVTFKDKLEVLDNGLIVDNRTGEVINLDGLSVVQEPEKLVIK